VALYLIRYGSFRIGFSEGSRDMSSAVSGAEEALSLTIGIISSP